MTDLIPRIHRYIKYSKYTHPAACLLLEEAVEEIQRLQADAHECRGELTECFGINEERQSIGPLTNGPDF